MMQAEQINIAVGVIFLINLFMVMRILQKFYHARYQVFYFSFEAKLKEIFITGLIGALIILALLAITALPFRWSGVEIFKKDGAGNVITGWYELTCLIIVTAVVGKWYSWYSKR